MSAPAPHDDGPLTHRAAGTEDLGFGDLAMLGFESRNELAERLEAAVALDLSTERRVDPGAQALGPTGGHDLVSRDHEVGID